MCSAQSRPSRSSLRPRTPPSHTPTCRSRRVGVHKAKDRSLSRRWPRMLSCDVCRQHEVRALMHMGSWTHHRSAPEVAARSNDCGAGIRSHQRPCSPDKRRGWATGVRRSWPGHTCRTEIDHDCRQQGNGARWEGSGVATSSAPKLLVSKTTTDAAAA